MLPYKHSANGFAYHAEPYPHVSHHYESIDRQGSSALSSMYGLTFGGSDTTSSVTLSAPSASLRSASNASISAKLTEITSAMEASNNNHLKAAALLRAASAASAKSGKPAPREESPSSVSRVFASARANARNYHTASPADA